MNWIKRFLVVSALTVLNFFSFSHADIDDLTLPAKDASIERAVSQLTQVLKKYVIALDRDLVVFHYQKPQASGWRPKSLLDVKNHLLNMPSRFHYVEFYESSVAGPGLYAAIDPVASRSYGGSVDPQLYVITLRKGANILKSTAKMNASERQVLNKILGDLQCYGINSAMDLDLVDVTTHLRQARRRRCVQTVASAYASLKISGIFYSYIAIPNLKGCRAERTGAINIIATDMIAENSLAWFSDQGQVNGEILGGVVRQLFDEANDIVSTKVNGVSNGYKPPTSLEGEPISDEQYTRWKSEKIYWCGSPWSLEDELGQ